MAASYINRMLGSNSFSCMSDMTFAHCSVVNNLRGDGNEVYHTVKAERERVQQG